MRKFDRQLFLELAFPPENGLMDRKSKLYVVYGDNKKKAEFVKDMIALANTSRRRGEPAYLLFGVRDESPSIPDEEEEYKGRFPGIQSQCARKPKCGGWEKWTLERRQEFVTRAYHDVIDDYVEPSPLSFEYLFGYIDGRLVSYIIIEYNQVESPFEAKKEIRDKEKIYINPGDCWCRIGESNKFVHPHEKQYLYLYSEVPYISKDMWKKHARHCVTTYRNPLDPEIPILITPASESHQYSWNDLLDEILVGDIPSITLLTGNAGAGKTTTLHWLMYELSSNLLANLEATGLEEQPSEPIPVYVSLNERRFRTNEEFQFELTARLDESHHLGLRSHSQAYAYFQQSDQEFMILLDGMDEIEPDGASLTRSVIKGVMDSSPPTMKFIVAGRTKGMKRSWRSKYPVLQLEDIEVTQIEDFLGATLSTVDEALDFINQDDDLANLVSCPLTLLSFQELWWEWEIELERALQENEGQTSHPFPSKADCVRGIVEKMLFHDVEKGILQGQNVVYEEQTTLGKLALQLKVKRLQKMRGSAVKDVLGERSYEHYIRLGLLRSSKGEVSFSNSLLFDYFAAYRLKEFLQYEGSVDALSWERCGKILSSFVMDLMPRLLGGYARLSTLSE
jgi:hypothetical protein